MSKQSPGESERVLFDDVPPELRALRCEMAEADERRRASARDLAARVVLRAETDDEPRWWYEDEEAARILRLNAKPILLTPEAEGWRRWVQQLVRRNHLVWALFAVLTFERFASFERAEKARLWWLRRLGQLPEALGSKAGRLRLLPWFSTIERHKSESAHVNVLVAGCGEVDLRAVRDLWVPRFGREAIVRPYDPENGDVLRYMLKHVGRDDTRPDLAREFRA